MYEAEKYIREYSYCNDTGDAQAVVYQLFPGVEVAYLSVHMADFDFGLFEQGERKNYVTIHYCREGRIEQQVNDEFFYLMPGDCSFAIHQKPSRMFQLPLKHYHGISIGIDLDCTQNPLMVYMESCGCSATNALRHICGGMSHIVLRSSDAAGKFFNDLYEADFDQRLDYLKVRMPELFYRMKYAKTDSSYYDRNLVQALNANKETVAVEVPYDPQRIAILDMPALDIVDALGVGDRVVGSAKVTIEYLKDYNPDDSNGDILNLGTVKTADLEKVAACEPDIIFIGGRLSTVYSDLEAIAPVVYLAVDYEKGIVESTKHNAQTIASIFGLETEIDAMFTDFQPRIDALNTILKDKNVLLGMYNANALGLMGTASQLNLIANELGANNLSESVGEAEKATHGEEASWETIITLNPEYMFILDRSTATEAADENIMGAREVIENDLIKELDVYKDGKIVYFIEHANVWYTSTGGIQALDMMLSDLEGALLR